MKFRTVYDPLDMGVEFKEESLTDPIYAEMNDIKVLALQQNVAFRTPVYGDEPDMTFEDWQNEKAMLNRRWLHLTPEMKEKFKTPSNFLSFCSNPDNFTREDGVLMFKDISDEKMERYKQKILKEYQESLEKQNLQVPPKE